MNERSPKEKPRLVLIMGGRMEQQHEKVKRQAQIREFIAACERLYEKNRQRERRDCDERQKYRL